MLHRKEFCRTIQGEPEGKGLSPGLLQLGSNHNRKDKMSAFIMVKEVKMEKGFIFVVHPELKGLIFHAGRREMKDYEIFWGHVTERNALIHKKWKTRKEAKFNRGDDNSLINNAIYLLFINYTNLNGASFCDFYSSGKAQFIICAIVAVCILALQRYFSRHNYDLFWRQHI